MTIPECFFSQAKRLEDERALIYKNGGLWKGISWREFAQKVKALSSYLIGRGIKKGDRVAILSENRPEWAVSDLAILAAGGITVPIYFTSTPRQTEFILSDSGSRTVIVSSAEQLKKVLGAAGREKAEDIIVMDEPAMALPGGVTCLASILKNFSGKEDARLCRAMMDIAEDDTASILYTSGTTGRPKGVMLTHGNFLFNARACTKVVDVKEDDLFLSFLPLSHAFERTVGYYVPLIAGATIAYAESIERIPRNISEVKPTIILGVPRFYEKTYTAIIEAVESGSPLKRAIFKWALDTGKKYSRLKASKKTIPISLKIMEKVADRIAYRKIKARLGGRLRFFVSGGAPLVGEIGAFFDAVNMPILEGYGLTETSPVITSNTLKWNRPGTVGRPLPGVEISLTPDGEIRTRGEHVMKGYYKRDDLTREVIRDGWLNTGDIGVIDSEGFLKITDRKKDMIVTSGGENVAPQAIETALVADPLISQIIVYGDGEKYLTALIVPDRGELEKEANSMGIPFSSFEELLEGDEVHRIFAARIDKRLENFAGFEKIRGFALLKEAFSMESGELTPTLKIKRRVAAEKYKIIIDKLYEES